MSVALPDMGGYVSREEFRRWYDEQPSGRYERIDGLIPGDSSRTGGPRRGEVGRVGVVVEVLPPVTASADTGAKLAGYFQVPSIAHYLIVHPPSGSSPTIGDPGAGSRPISWWAVRSISIHRASASRSRKSTRRSDPVQAALAAMPPRL